MLNRVILMGRLTHDLELKRTQSGAVVLAFTIAVDRGYTKLGEERQTDFINCVAWNQRAEFIGKYFAKGRMIAVEGQLRTRTYDDKNGTRHYITEVFVDSVSFTGEPKPQDQGGYQNNYGSNPYNGGYQNNNYQQNSNYSGSSQPQNNNSGYAPPASDLDDLDVLSDEGVPF